MAIHHFVGAGCRFIQSDAILILGLGLRARGSEGLGPEHFVVGVTLLIGWVILLAATQRSLGFLGLLLGSALLGGVMWLLVDIDWLNVNSMTEATWIGLVCVSSLLAVGLSWSHVWRRLTGQFEVDDNDG